MNALYVLYDPYCPLCRRCRDWMHKQPTYWPVHFLARNGPERRRLFPELIPEVLGDDLVVIDGSGQLWRGGRAWIMCLWVLRGYRPMAFYLAEPSRQGLARAAFEAVSKNRRFISRFLFGRGDKRRFAATLQAGGHKDCRICAAPPLSTSNATNRNP